MKTVIIGLDGATFDVINPWIEQGKLPNFKKIIDNGFSGTLNSTIPCATAPALPAFFTGKNPETMGVFGFTKPDGSVISLLDIKGDKIWNILDRNHLRSCILNMRITYPVEEINGIMVTGSLLSPSSPSKNSMLFHPKELENELKDFHVKRAEFESLVKDIDGNRDKILQLTKKITQNKYDTFKRLMKRDSHGFDFSVFWIDHTDTLQHIFWHDKEALLDFFVFLDGLLADALKNFEDSNIIIISDHGFEAAPNRRFHANTWLEKEGYLSTKGGAFTHLLHSVGKNKHIRNLGRRVLISKSKKQESAREGITDSKKNIYGIDVGRSKAFLHQKWGIGLIRENIRDYESTRDEIINKMRLLKDSSGKMIFKFVWKREDLYKGTNQKIPDIIFLTNEGYTTDYYLSKNLISSIKKTVMGKHYSVTGAHDNAINGVLMAYGKDIAKGKAKIASIIDIAPTVLHMFGIPIPNDMDGRVLEEMFRPESQPGMTNVRHVNMDKERQVIDAAIKNIRF